MTAHAVEIESGDRGADVRKLLRTSMVGRQGLALYGRVDDLLPTSDGPALRLPQVLALAAAERGANVVLLNPVFGVEHVAPPGRPQSSVELPGFTEDSDELLSLTLRALARSADRFVLLLTGLPCSAEHGDRTTRTLLRSLPVSTVMPANVSLVIAFATPQPPDFLVGATGWTTTPITLPDIWERRSAMADWQERGIFTTAELDVDDIAGSTAGLELDDLRRLVEEHEHLAPLTRPRIAEARQVVMERRLEGLFSVEHRPSVSFDDVVGGEAVKDLARMCDFRPIGLFGPPGTGKTLLALAFARELGFPLIHMDTRLKGGFTGETARNIALVREVLTAYAPAVLFIDEVDLLFGSTSDYNGDNGTSNEIRKFVLEFLNNAKKLNVQVIVASNNPWSRIQSRTLDRVRAVPVFPPTGGAVLAIARLEAAKEGYRLNREAEELFASAAHDTWTGRRIERVIGSACSRARRVQATDLSRDILAPWFKGVSGRRDRAAELNLLEAVLVSDPACLPGIARADAGLPPAPLPRCLDGLVDADGVPDNALIEAELRSDGLREAR